MSVPSSSALRLNLLSHVHPPSRPHRGYVSRSYDWRSPDAIASALIPASSALFAEMMATCQPVSGLGCTCTSCPSSARPSLIISANSSAAILVFCMARFQCSRQTIGQVRVFTNSTVIISLFHWIPFSGAFCGGTGVFPSAREFCSKVWRVGHTTRTNNAPAARFGPTQSSFAGTMLLSPHEPNGRCDSGINGRRGDCAIAGADRAR